MSSGPVSKLMVVAWLLLASLLSFNVPPHTLLHAGDLPGVAGAQPDGPGVPPLLPDRADEETSRDDLDDDLAAADAPVSGVDVPHACGQHPRPAEGPTVVAFRVMSCIGARGPPVFLPAA